MMQAEFDEANVARDAAVISCPGVEHGPRINFGLDFGKNPAFSLVTRRTTIRRLLVEADFAVLETRVVMHCPRLPAIAAGRLLPRRPGEHERFLAALGGFEALERLPTRSVTGYFVAARCTSYA
jgi:hypothetical protein